MRLYIFGNGNLSFADFLRYYAFHLDRLDWDQDPQFILCDFRGTDTLALEYLKTRSSRVSIYHVGDRPRYLPDKFKTKVDQWQILGGFSSDAERDQAAIEACTHFLAFDFNSDLKRTSGTQKNIERLLELGKLRIIDKID